MQTDDQLLGFLSRLPEEVVERLFDAANGKLVAPAEPQRDPVTAPDTLRRFILLDSDTDLAAALDAPLKRWTVFLHPSQRAVAYGAFSGPVKVTGSAGTGKTWLAELAILNDVGRALSSALDLDQLLEMVHQQVSRVFDTTNFYIAAYDEETDEYEILLDTEEGAGRLPTARVESRSLPGKRLPSSNLAG